MTIHEGEHTATYKIVRFCFDENDPQHKSVIKTGLTLDEAQAHCQREDTHGDGWFDGYDKEFVDRPFVAIAFVYPDLDD